MFDSGWKLQAVSEELLHYLSINNGASEFRKYDECDTKPTIFQLIPDLEEKEDALANAKLESGCICDLNLNLIKSLIPYLCQQDEDEATHGEFSQMYFWIDSIIYKHQTLASIAIFKQASKSFERTETKFKEHSDKQNCAKSNKCSSPADDIGSISSISC